MDCGSPYILPGLCGLPYRCCDLPLLHERQATVQQYALRPHRQPVDGNGGRLQKGGIGERNGQGEGHLHSLAGRQGQKGGMGLSAAGSRWGKGHLHGSVRREPAADVYRVCDGLAGSRGSSTGMGAEHGAVQRCGVLQPCGDRRSGLPHPGQGPQHAETLNRVIEHAAGIQLVGRFAVQQGCQRLPVYSAAGSEGFLAGVVTVALFAALLVAVVVNAVADQDNMAVAAFIHHQQVTGAEQCGGLAADPAAFLRRFRMTELPSEHAGLDHLRHVPGEISVQYPAKCGMVYRIDEGGAVQKQHMLHGGRFRRSQLVPARCDLHHTIHASLVILDGIAPCEKCFRGGQQGGSRQISGHRSSF